MTDLAARLAAVIDPTRIRTDTDSLQQYGRDWTRYYAPAASAVVFPHSLGEVQALVQLARAERLALVPSGGRTGLSGGACGKPAADAFYVAYRLPNTLRRLFAEQPVGSEIWTALAWCVGILLVAYTVAVRAYRGSVASS